MPNILKSLSYKLLIVAGLVKVAIYEKYSLRICQHKTFPQNNEEWCNPGNGVALSPIPQCSSYWKGSIRVTLD